MDNKAASVSEESNSVSTKSRSMSASKLNQKQRREAEVEMMRIEVVDLLKYWVVYSILHALVRTVRLIPILGRVFTVTGNVSSSAMKARLFGRLLKSNIRPSQKFVQEISLVFFVWLRLMPASIAGDDVKEKVTKVLTTKIPTESGFSGSKRGSKNRPLDLLYYALSPVVLSAMSSSAFLTKRAFGETRNSGSTLASMIIQKMQSFLDLFVMVRLMRAETKDWIVNTISEGSALLPAVPTLLMPSYFTQYGIIYVSLIVPAGYSISSCEAIQGPARNTVSMTSRMDDAARYLQFWLVHAAVSALIASFDPILAWIPLSTHATWLLWAYVQLQSSTRKIMSWFESERTKSFGETVVAQSLKKFIAMLPSNVQEDPDSNNALVASGEKCKNE